MTSMSSTKHGAIYAVNEATVDEVPQAAVAAAESRHPIGAWHVPIGKELADGVGIVDAGFGGITHELVGELLDVLELLVLDIDDLEVVTAFGPRLAIAAVTLVQGRVEHDGISLADTMGPGMTIGGKVEKAGHRAPGRSPLKVVRLLAPRVAADAGAWLSLRRLASWRRR